MRRFGPLLVVLAVSCSASTKGPRGPRKQLTAKDIVAQSTGAIVRIEAGENTGTGFIVDKTGLVATNLHVVAGAKAVSVKLHGGETYPVMVVAGVDPARDLALLRIATPKPLPVLRLGDSSVVSAGDQIVAIGNPLGVFTYSVSSGLISQVRLVCTKEQVDRNQRNQARVEQLTVKAQALVKCEAERGAAGASARAPTCDQYKLTPAEEQEIESLRCRDELTILQISAPISQGSSGGPLFNQFGEVVGVTTAIITGGQNINLAIPTNYVKPMVAKPLQISMDDFATKTRGLVERASAEDGVKIQRMVPDHAATIFKGCKEQQIGDMVVAIEQAIEVGAPLYNKGEIEACFRIYEGTAVKFEREPGCSGISTAFGDGLLRAKTLDTYKEKAWAMRDTFDGLLNAAKRWVQNQPPTKQPAPKK